MGYNISNANRDSDWFRLETMDDSLQPTIDMLLNLSVFMWFGAVCPWSSFLNNSVIPIYRLIFLGVLILLVRRLPIVFAMHKWIPQIDHVAQAAFVGFFGPIGVGAIFYLSVSLEFLRKIQVEGEVPEDVKQVMETIQVVVWFLVICSIVSSPRPNPTSSYFTHLLTKSRLCMASQSPLGKPAITSQQPSPTSSASAPAHTRNANRSPSQTPVTHTARQHLPQRHLSQRGRMRVTAAASVVSGAQSRARPSLALVAR